MRPMILLCALSLALGACTSAQWYRTGQAWQRQQCERLPDPADRARCQASTATSYEDYRREAEAAKASGR